MKMLKPRYFPAGVSKHRRYKGIDVPIGNLCNKKFVGNAHARKPK